MERSRLSFQIDECFIKSVRNEALRRRQRAQKELSRDEENHDPVRSDERSSSSSDRSDDIVKKIVLGRPIL